MTLLCKNFSQRMKYVKQVKRFILEWDPFEATAQKGANSPVNSLMRQPDTEQIFQHG